MFNSRIISCIRKASNLKTIVLGLLVTCMLLSTCAVRKSIEAFFQGSAHTESSMVNGFGFKKIRAISDNVQFASPQLCSSDDRTILQNIDQPGSKVLGSLLPQALFLTTLLGFISAVLLALWHHRLARFYPQASLAFNSTPLYIKNRLLLI
ncbi:hypothetical protein BCY91_06660 [Pelobium manganitolerans]|uniref:Uncharacterized protein n=1 Tax=Pelobium manganitolerans TaxID=1842495 RepID=A0A419S5E2_9SPHI|nr:hypothetical protein BCY91_06660 [Pelobium manganitolerans]